MTEKIYSISLQGFTFSDKRRVDRGEQNTNTESNDGYDERYTSLSMLQDEGYLLKKESHSVLTWDKFYELSKDAESSILIGKLDLPNISDARPRLDCSGTFTDSDFKIFIDGWDIQKVVSKLNMVEGPVFTDESGAIQILNQPSWEIYRRCNQFQTDQDIKTVQRRNEFLWAEMRGFVREVNGIYLSRFLEKTIILTPNMLRFDVDKTMTKFGASYTVKPTFEDAPENWLDYFDKYKDVQDIYRIVKGQDRDKKIILTEPVKEVLSYVKKEMPGRKVAGKKAEQFIKNPHAILGDIAKGVVEDIPLEESLAKNGITACTFYLRQNAENGVIKWVDLEITDTDPAGNVRAYTYPLKNVDELKSFLDQLEKSLINEREFFAYEEFDFALDFRSNEQLDRGRNFLQLIEIQKQKPIEVEEIFTLGQYSDRVVGIGPAKPIVVPVLIKPKNPDEDSSEYDWIPDIPGVSITIEGSQEQVIIPLDNKWIGDFEKKVEEAEEKKQEEVRDSELPCSISTNQAKRLVENFKAILNAREEEVGKKKQRREEAAKKPKLQSQTLLFKTNFHDAEYVKSRASALKGDSRKKAELPECLKGSVSLKDHQLEGVRWFQNLFEKEIEGCRGAILADDMGLGKTIQILTFIAWFFEKKPDAPPAIIVVPKTLLQNWGFEISKFFTSLFPVTLSFDKATLSKLRQPKDRVSENLRGQGIANLLAPDWLGAARLVIVTYETIASFEFSFAKQDFSILVCDEAQRIKNPGTKITGVIKKLKTNFSIACTGTPVENSLVDLWCLFDFVQPGLLGSLEQFGKIYRRPIECETDEQRESLERLQDLIEPQILRRLKSDIAQDLPKKYFVYNNGSEIIRKEKNTEDKDLLSVNISDYQKILYKDGLFRFKRSLNDKEEEMNKKMRVSFDILHFMRAVCSEPYCIPGKKFMVDSAGHEKHLENSPKMSWLLQTLEHIKSMKEKALVFTEFKEFQLALCEFLNTYFGLRPNVINGASEKRHEKIEEFSAGTGFDVLILSPIAAGAGLNITAANHVIHFTRCWNPAKESQATDRAYRIGSEKDVHVYSPTTVAEFKTFDVRLDELLKTKSRLAEATLENDRMGAMLNGAGEEIKITDIFDDPEGGEEMPTIIISMDEVDRLDAFGFEAFCMLLWSRKKFNAIVTAKSGGDHGVDVLALKGKNEGILLQCKSSKNIEIGWEGVKDVVAGLAHYQQIYKNTKFKKYAVTNQLFNQNAIEQAEINEVTLYTRNDIIKDLQKYKLTNVELSNALKDAHGQSRR